MTDVTRILSAIEEGDPLAAEQLLPLVYDELRKLAAQKMAQEAPGQTFRATALVHEAYLRLVNVERVQRWDSRGHFFAAAAAVMQRILVENARRKGRARHGVDSYRVPLEDSALIGGMPCDDRRPKCVSSVQVHRRRSVGPSDGSPALPPHAAQPPIMDIW